MQFIDSKQGQIFASRNKKVFLFLIIDDLNLFFLSEDRKEVKTKKLFSHMWLSDLQ